MCKTLLAGTLRKTLVGTVATLSGSAGLGGLLRGWLFEIPRHVFHDRVFDLRWQMQAFSGSTLVTSSVVVNSGNSLLDVLNYGKFVDLSVTAAKSQVSTILILGDPSPDALSKFMRPTSQPETQGLPCMLQPDDFQGDGPGQERQGRSPCCPM